METRRQNNFFGPLEDELAPAGSNSWRFSSKSEGQIIRRKSQDEYRNDLDRQIEEKKLIRKQEFEHIKRLSLDASNMKIESMAREDSKSLAQENIPSKHVHLPWLSPAPPASSAVNHVQTSSFPLSSTSAAPAELKFQQCIPRQHQAPKMQCNNDIPTQISYPQQQSPKMLWNNNIPTQISYSQQQSPKIQSNANIPTQVSYPQQQPPQLQCNTNIPTQILYSQQQSPKIQSNANIPTQISYPQQQPPQSQCNTNIPTQISYPQQQPPQLQCNTNIPTQISYPQQQSPKMQCNTNIPTQISYPQQQPPQLQCNTNIPTQISYPQQQPPKMQCNTNIPTQVSYPQQQSPKMQCNTNIPTQISYPQHQSPKIQCNTNEPTQISYPQQQSPRKQWNNIPIQTPYMQQQPPKMCDNSISYPQQHSPKMHFNNNPYPQQQQPLDGSNNTTALPNFQTLRGSIVPGDATTTFKNPNSQFLENQRPLQQQMIYANDNSSNFPSASIEHRLSGSSEKTQSLHNSEPRSRDTVNSVTNSSLPFQQHQYYNNQNVNLAQSQSSKYKQESPRCIPLVERPPIPVNQFYGLSEQPNYSYIAKDHIDLNADLTAKNHRNLEKPHVSQTADQRPGEAFMNSLFKADLDKQIEEKKRLEQQRLIKEREEEKLFLQKIKADQEKMRREFEEEVFRQKKKDEIVRKRQEDSIKIEQEILKEAELVKKLKEDQKKHSHCIDNENCSDGNDQLEIKIKNQGSEKLNEYVMDKNPGYGDERRIVGSFEYPRYRDAETQFAKYQDEESTYNCRKMSCRPPLVTKPEDLEFISTLKNAVESEARRVQYNLDARKPKFVNFN